MNEIIKKSKKNEFSKYVVLLILTLFIIYISANVVMQWIKGYSMPTDINAGVFAFLTGELGILSIIKRAKILNGDKKEEKEQH